jgi:hypothetical protein
MSIAAEIAAWVVSQRHDDLPADVVEAWRAHVSSRSSAIARRRCSTPGRHRGRA